MGHKKLSMYTIEDFHPIFGICPNSCTVNSGLLLNTKIRVKKLCYLLLHLISIQINFKNILYLLLQYIVFWSFSICFNLYFKACARCFLSNSYHQMIALQKIWKMFFISSKKLFLFSRYSMFCIFVFPSFSPSAIALRPVSSMLTSTLQYNFLPHN